MSNGIEIARRALQANNYVLDTIGNNIANVNTPGYSRQRVSLKPADNHYIAVDNNLSPFAAVGTGVSVHDVQRLRSDLFDGQMRNITNEQGSWEQQTIAYSYIESIINEPSDMGIASNLEEFWNSWYYVQLDPSDSGARSNVISVAQQLAQNFNLKRELMVNLQKDFDENIPIKINEANSLIKRLGNLNSQIVRAEAAGSSTSLKDERTKLANELIKIIGADYYEDDRGVISIALDGVILVSESEVEYLDARLSTDQGSARYDIFLQDTLRTVNINNGEIGGIINSRDIITQGFIDKLDELAITLASKINDIHREGYDLNGNNGINFFEATGAHDLKVNSFISLYPSLIAASSLKDNVEGNGENALAIISLKESGVFDSETITINQYYYNLISDLGINSRVAQNNVQGNQDIINQINNHIAEISGVSIDEEMSDMIRYQHAYQASAKYMSVIQTILDTLVNMV
jgi:flagellar hook-associated protein 1